MRASFSHERSLAMGAKSIKASAQAQTIAAASIEQLAQLLPALSAADQPANESSAGSGSKSSSDDDSDSGSGTAIVVCLILILVRVAVVFCFDHFHYMQHC